MDIDPMEAVENGDEEEEETGEKTSSAAEAARRKSRLNALVAVTVALLATFMGICKVKDDNIVQAMQQAQADKIDNYSWYQARNIREEVASVGAATLRAQRAAAPAAARAEYDKQIAELEKRTGEQHQKKEEQLADAKKADDTYNALNYHDDQFDLSDALLAIAVSLLAVTALTQKRWLYYVALAPTFFGVLMGCAGLFGWRLHSDLLAKLLGT